MTYNSYNQISFLVSKFSTRAFSHSSIFYQEIHRQHSWEISTQLGNIALLGAVVAGSPPPRAQQGVSPLTFRTHQDKLVAIM